jgi:multicomponent Na+:H+ antiporter subunit F
MIPVFFLNIMLFILILAMLMTLIRLIRGPSLLDRIVAMDLMAAITSGFILIIAIYTNNSVYIDIAIIISLVSFIGTVAISKYLHKNIKK